MKKIFISAVVLVLTTTLSAQSKIGDIAKFTAEIINFGKVKQNLFPNGPNTPVVGVFTVTNISNHTLLIEEVRPTCPCLANYTKDSIAPGKTGIITASYDAQLPGHFDKHFMVKFAGLDEMKNIGLSGDVITAEEFDKLKPVETKGTADPAAKAIKKDKKLNNN